MHIVAPPEIGFAVRDLDALLPFYTGVLGFAVVGDAQVPPATSARTGLAAHGYRVVRLRAATGQVVKLAQPEPAPATPPPREHPMDVEQGCYLTLIVADLPALRARIEAAGHALASEGIVEVRPGVHLMLMRDPAGNFLEFVAYDDLAAYLAPR